MRLHILDSKAIYELNKVLNLKASSLRFQELELIDTETDLLLMGHHGAAKISKFSVYLYAIPLAASSGIQSILLVQSCTIKSMVDSP